MKGKNRTAENQRAIEWIYDQHALTNKLTNNIRRGEKKEKKSWSKVSGEIER